MTNTTEQAEILKTWPGKVYASHMRADDDGKPYEEYLHQRIFCVANEPHFCGDNVEYIRADTVRKLQLEAIQTALDYVENKCDDYHYDVISNIDLEEILKSLGK